MGFTQLIWRFGMINEYKNMADKKGEQASFWV